MRIKMEMYFLLAFYNFAMDKQTAYTFLNVNDESTLEEIKASYRKLARKLHPDRPGGNEEQFKKLTEAYTLLQTPTDALGDTFSDAFSDTFSDAFSDAFSGVFGFSAKLDLPIETSISDILNKTVKEIYIQSMRISVVFEAVDDIHDVSDHMFTYSLFPKLTSTTENGFKLIKPNHLSMDVKISITEAIYGTTLYITDPYNKRQKVTIKPIKKITPSLRVVVPGRGLPHTKKGHGNLILNLHIEQLKMNSQLLKENEQLLKRIFSC